jgi:hypothetical protein
MTATQTAMVGVALATTAASLYAQQQSGKAQAKAINQQNQQQADEIAQQAGVEMGERMRAARRERGDMRAAASESGINLNSNSFMSALQTSVMNESNDSGLIMRNETNKQAARSAETNSLMSRIQMPTAASAAFSLGTSAAGAYFGSGGIIRTK